MPETLKVTQIGIAHTHANNALAAASRPVTKQLNMEMAGIYEPDPDMWEARHKRPEYADIPKFDSVDQILNDPSIKAVFIQTWPWECLYWARLALQAGKHIHLDKPPGLSLPMLKELYALAASKGLFIQMGYMWRFNAGFEWAQKAVKDGLIGRVTFARFRAGSVPEYWNRNHVHQFPGGIMQEESCHLFDQAAAMFGRPDKITPILRSDARGFEGMPPGVDNAIVIMEYEKQGAMAVIEATGTESDPGPHRHAEIHGLEGSIVLQPIEPPAIDLCLRQDKGEYRKGWQKIAVENRPRYTLDLVEFAGVIRGEISPRFTPEHDLIAHETLIRACGGVMPAGK
ncbi:MAG: Gfo/Idh/MocA family oxidoreductase [SAR202 cluster bacterium]|nr:Gfo/Idh/MocA family oxidoreductase [SAR202 cluster bacterium]